MIHKIPRFLVNILTVNDKDYLLNRDKLKEPIQAQLSRKLKAFSEFLLQFLKSILNFKHLAKKDDRHS